MIAPVGSEAPAPASLLASAVTTDRCRRGLDHLDLNLNLSRGQATRGLRPEGIQERLVGAGVRLSGEPERSGILPATIVSPMGAFIGINDLADSGSERTNLTQAHLDI